MATIEIGGTKQRIRRARGAGIQRAAIAVALLGALSFSGRTALAGGDWNDGAVKWRSYEDGLAAAKKENKPILLIVYTEWCPHCANYSGVFHDPKVVEEVQKFVLIRIDKDKYPDISKKYAPDGEYNPRSYFLKPDGTLDAEIHAPREQYKYFYDERVPGSILGGMDEALKKFGPAMDKAKGA